MSMIGNLMRKTFILKIGGSVLTFKDGRGLKIREKLLREIALQIKKTIQKKSMNLIIIHGAGSFGHRIAKKFKLKDGVGKDFAKWNGVVMTKILCQELNLKFAEIFAEAGLAVFTLQSCSLISNKDKKISKLDLQKIKIALNNNLIPVLYGDMVFDESLGASICSGDSIVARLAGKMKPEKIYFATDVDGIFTDDPHKNKKATIIREINLNKLSSEKNIKLAQSHSLDVTGGLQGKIKKLSELVDSSHVKEIVIFNGLQPEKFSRALLEKQTVCTKIKTRGA